MKKSRHAFLVRILFFILTLAFNFQSYGQAEKTDEDRAKVITNWMKDKLSLTDEQVGLISDVNLNFVKENRQVLTQYANNLPAETEKISEVFNVAIEEWRKIFTDEQLKKILEIREEFLKHLKTNVFH